MSKKSRKLIRSGVPAPATVAETVATAETQHTFFFLPDVEPDEVDERDLHDLMKLWRHGRATRTIGQVISDGYVTIFTVVLIGAMVTSAVVNAQHGMTGCTTEACNSSRLLLPSAMVFGCWALAAGLAAMFGPILASAPEGSWLMAAPISRRRLLRGRLVAPLVAAFVVPVLLTALVGALSGMAWVSVGLWSLAAGCGSAALVAFAAAEQTRERTIWLKLLQGLWAVATLLVAVLVVAVAAGWLPASAVAAGTNLEPVVIGVAVLAVVVIVGSLVVALRRLELIRRARLLSGGSLVAGMQGAMFALDLGLIRDILVERKAIAKGHVRPTKGRGLGITALIWRDAERLFRAPSVFIGLLMSLLVPYAVDALRMSQLNPLISGLALTAALVPFLGSLRVLTRTGGLARSMPFKTTEIRTAAMAVPSVLAVAWAAAATPAFIGIASTGVDRDLLSGATAALITGVAGLFGAVRWVTAGRPDFSAPLMATASGAMPPTLIFNLFRGFDMVALITAPLILGVPAYWSAILAVVVFVGLRGTFNMEDLKAEQEIAQREAAALKKDRGERTKIPPPKR